MFERQTHIPGLSFCKSTNVFASSTPAARPATFSRPEDSSSQVRFVWSLMSAFTASSVFVVVCPSVLPLKRDAASPSGAVSIRRETNAKDSSTDARNAVDAATRSSELSTRASTAAQNDVKRSSSGWSEEAAMTYGLL